MSPENLNMHGMTTPPYLLYLADKNRKDVWMQCVKYDCRALFIALHVIAVVRSVLMSEGYVT